MSNLVAEPSAYYRFLYGEIKDMYIVLQNKVIIDTCDSREKALERITIEKNKDMVSIVIKKKLRKLFLKDPSNIALHSYSIMKVTDVEEINA